MITYKLQYSWSVWNLPVGSRILFHLLSSSCRVIISQKFTMNLNREVNYWPWAIKASDQYMNIVCPSGLLCVNISSFFFFFAIFHNTRGGGTSAAGIHISACKCRHDNHTLLKVHEGDDSVWWGLGKIVYTMTVLILLDLLHSNSRCCQFQTPSNVHCINASVSPQRSHLIFNP